jgi:hypothetical protein
MLFSRAALAGLTRRSPSSCGYREQASPHEMRIEHTRLVLGE